MHVFRALPMLLVAFLAWPCPLPAQPTIADTGSEIIIRLSAVNLPVHGSGHAHAHMGVFPPVGNVKVPVSGHIYGFRYRLVDGEGKEIPRVTLHHFNVIDPDHRELFLPISRRLLAAGQETGQHALPWLLFGIPVHKGQNLVVSAMLHNPTDTEYRDVSLEIVMEYVPEGRPWPFYSVYPFQIDVAFPAGDKSFDLPPGEFSKSWEGSPSVAGRIVGIGGHLHQYATRLTLEDITDGELLWTGYPKYTDKGAVESVTAELLFARLGIPIRPSDTYRITVYYDNPTGSEIPDGGMGVLAGVFVPDDSSQWPMADSDDDLYRLDRLHYLREVSGSYELIADVGDTADDAPEAPHEQEGEHGNHAPTHNHVH